MFRLELFLMVMFGCCFSSKTLLGNDDCRGLFKAAANFSQLASFRYFYDYAMTIPSSSSEFTVIKFNTRFTQVLSQSMGVISALYGDEDIETGVLDLSSSQWALSEVPVYPYLWTHANIPVEVNQLSYQQPESFPTQPTLSSDEQWLAYHVTSKESNYQQIEVLDLRRTYAAWEESELGESQISAEDYSAMGRRVNIYDLLAIDQQRPEVTAVQLSSNNEGGLYRYRDISVRMDFVSNTELLAIHIEDRTAASYEKQRLFLYDVVSRKVIWAGSGDGKGPNELYSFSEGILLTDFYADGQSIHLSINPSDELDTVEPVIRKLTLHKEEVPKYAQDFQQVIAVSPGGDLIVTKDGATVHFMDLQNANQLNVFKKALDGYESIDSFTFSNDGRYLAVIASLRQKFGQGTVSFSRQLVLLDMENSEFPVVKTQRLAENSGGPYKKFSVQPIEDSNFIIQVFYTVSNNFNEYPRNNFSPRSDFVTFISPWYIRPGDQYEAIAKLEVIELPFWLDKSVVDTGSKAISFISKKRDPWQGVFRIQSDGSDDGGDEVEETVPELPDVVSH